MIVNEQDTKNKQNNQNLKNKIKMQIKLEI